MSNQQIRMNPKTKKNQSTVFEDIPGEFELESTRNPRFPLQFFPRHLLTKEMAMLDINLPLSE